ncbi:hypothetical protein TWF569_010366 [Orbilia oligospora]|nr:hypothetical protein TWF569_010366 [Orbilia oligospora]
MDVGSLPAYAAHTPPTNIKLPLLSIPELCHAHSTRQDRLINYEMLRDYVALYRRIIERRDLSDAIVHQSTIMHLFRIRG